jgi:hypothetical protein
VKLSDTNVNQCSSVKLSDTNVNQCSSVKLSDTNVIIEAHQNESFIELHWFTFVYESFTELNIGSYLYQTKIQMWTIEVHQKILDTNVNHWSSSKPRYKCEPMYFTRNHRYKCEPMKFRKALRYKCEPLKFTNKF